MFDTLFKNITVITSDSTQPILNNAYVGIKDGKIAYLSSKEPETSGNRVIDGTNKLLMPGLVNIHTHAAMSVMRGYADDYNLQTWLNDYVFPAEANLDDECVYIGSLLS